MKKNIIFLLIIFTVTSFAENTDMVEFRGGLNYGGEYNNINLENEKTGRSTEGFGFEGMVELIHRPIPHLITGLGTGYQKLTGAKGKSGKKYDLIDTIPVYLTIKYEFNEEGTYKPYFKLDLGASIPNTKGALDRRNTKADTGFYYSFGGGLEYNNFILEISYQYNENKLVGDLDGRIKYSRTVLGFGYRLGI